MKNEILSDEEIGKLLDSLSSSKPYSTRNTERTASEEKAYWNKRTKKELVDCIISRGEDMEHSHKLVKHHLLLLKKLRRMVQVNCEDYKLSKCLEDKCNFYKECNPNKKKDDI
jgi:flagellar motor switch protein FliM